MLPPALLQGWLTRSGGAAERSLPSVGRCSDMGMASSSVGRASIAASALFVIGLAWGCADNKDSNLPKGGNGVDDVSAACEIRAKWNRSGNDCSICEAAVISQRCDCTSLAAFGAACLDQQTARKKVCSEAVDDCISACDRTNCACIEACYTNGDACQRASAARDGCIVEVCDSHCK